MNRLYGPAPASSPSKDQLVGGRERAGNSRGKGCLEVLGLWNDSFLLMNVFCDCFPSFSPPPTSTPLSCNWRPYPSSRTDRVESSLCRWMKWHLIRSKQARKSQMRKLAALLFPKEPQRWRGLRQRDRTSGWAGLKASATPTRTALLLALKDFQGHLQPCREVVGLPPAGGHGEEGLCAGQRRDLVEQVHHSSARKEKNEDVINNIPTELQLHQVLLVWKAVICSLIYGDCFSSVAETQSVFRGGCN